GDTVSYSCTLANVTQDVTNVATATGTDTEGHPQTATDQATVTVIHPSITITKSTGTPQILSGGAASFGITLKNNGDVPLPNVPVTDAQAPGCERTAAQIASDRGSSTFAPTDESTSGCPLPNVTASLTNTATATGTTPIGSDVTASSSASVTVIHPAIA